MNFYFIKNKFHDRKGLKKVEMLTRNNNSNNKFLELLDDTCNFKKHEMKMSFYYLFYKMQRSTTGCCLLSALR